MSWSMVEPIMALPRRVFSILLAWREGTTMATEEEMKMMPSMRETMPEKPRAMPMAKPARKGMNPFMKATTEIFSACFRKLVKRISSPAMNMRNTRPISPMNSITSLGMKTSGMLGPIIIPAIMSPTAHGRCKRANNAEKKTAAKSIIKKEIKGASIICI